MGKKIRLLDCTLRDGSHLNEGDFGEKVIRGTINLLDSAEIDIIEVGFMWDQVTGSEISRYYNIDELKSILPPNLKNSKISVMIEKQNIIDNIEENDGTIEFIRVIFKRHLIDWALKTVCELKKKGYKCFMNPVNCSVYTDEEYVELIEKINTVQPYGFSIVDTFGVMRIEDIRRRYMLVERYLEKGIVIGVHLHENLGLAYAMAQSLIEILDKDRNIVIDGSLMGMGRNPGNLRIEQIAEYLNYKLGEKYKLPYIYEAIDKYIAPISEKIAWGFSLPYAFSANYGLHRTYPEFLMQKHNLGLKDIDYILSKVEKEEAEYYNEKYIERLYNCYIKNRKL